LDKKDREAKVRIQEDTKKTTGFKDYRGSKMDRDMIRDSRVKDSRAKCYKRTSNESTRGKNVSGDKTQEAMSIERIQGKTREAKSSMRMNKSQ
jgi:hypothetical protein